MGRRKLEMKRIKDKSSRQVTFSKWRGGLMKKERQLSVLCDCDIAIVIFFGRGKLYDFCSGNMSFVVSVPKADLHLRCLSLPRSPLRLRIHGVCSSVFHHYLAIFNLATSSDSLAEIWPLSIHDNEHNNNLLLRMAGGFSEENRDMTSIAESTVTEQSGSRFATPDAKKRRDANSENESSKIVSTGSSNDFSSGNDLVVCNLLFIQFVGIFFISISLSLLFFFIWF